MSVLHKYTPQQVDVWVREVSASLERGTRLQETLSQLPAEKEFHNELVEIAKARMSAEKTRKDLFMTQEDLRFATNELVASWRAKRLSCKKIIDLGCGVGIQSLAFAKTCDKVVGVDIDERKVAYAKANAVIQKIENVDFICADAVEFLKTASADIVFWDPERPPSEAERTLDSLKPSFQEIVKKASRAAQGFAVELPPQIQTIPDGFEAEYSSVDGKLNRLTIYGGKLRNAEKSAVALPQQAVLFSTGKASKSGELQQYLGEIDEAVIKAGLTGEISIVLWQEDDFLATAEHPTPNPFLNWWKVLAVCDDSDEDIVRELRKANTGKIILHQSLEPEKYWKARKVLEEKLKGTKTVAVFRTGKSAVIAQSVANASPIK